MGKETGEVNQNVVVPFVLRRMFGHGSTEEVVNP